MDKTFNKLLLVVVAVVVFETMSFNVTVAKTQFGLFNGIVKTVGTVKSIVKAVK